jgi:hypothetical protein
LNTADEVEAARNGEADAEPPETNCLKGLAASMYEPVPTRTLFHYASMAGFKGIVESRRMWATHMEYLSDAAEFKYAERLLLSEIERRRAAMLHEKDELRWLLLRQIQLFVEGAHIDSHVCVICFTERGNLLSQWRGYCLWQRVSALDLSLVHSWRPPRSRASPWGSASTM